MNNQIILTIVLCALATVLVRVLPVVFLSRMNIPAIVRDWLDFIPAAIMAAIIATEILTKPEVTPSGVSVSLLAAIIAALIGFVSKSLFLTVLAGVVAYLGLQVLLL